MNEPTDSMALLLEKERTRREQLRLERAKLRWGRNSVLVALWVVLAAIIVVGMFTWDQDGAESLAGGVIVFGALATVFLLLVLS